MFTKLNNIDERMMTLKKYLTQIGKGFIIFFHIKIESLIRGNKPSNQIHRDKNGLIFVHINYSLKLS